MVMLGFILEDECIELLSEAIINGGVVELLFKEFADAADDDVGKCKTFVGSLQSSPLKPIAQIQ